MLKNTNAAKEFGVYYYRLASDDEYAVKQDTGGSRSSLPQAFRLAAGHCAAAELLRGEYAKAVVFNRWKGHLIRVYTLHPGHAIQIKEY
jgi:hypothetical protein